MLKSLIQLLQTGTVTQKELFPDLPSYNRGLPMLTDHPCTECGECEEVCPTEAIEIGSAAGKPAVTLDLGKCIACGLCASVCKTGTITKNLSTRVAVRKREQLISSTNVHLHLSVPAPESIFKGSIHIREVSTGDNASDLEIAAANNPIFDASRFGIHFVASPRFADALIVTGPVAKPMQEPLRRCNEAMAEPKIVIAAGAPAISGVPHTSYAETKGVDTILPVSAYIPGFPPHPWYILHGILLAMGHPILAGTSYAIYYAV